MTRKVKRFVVLIVAGILLVCAAFASLAEGMTEGTEIPAEIEAIESQETSETGGTIQETDEPEEVNTESVPESETEQPAAETETGEAKNAPEPETVDGPASAEPETSDTESIPESGQEPATQPDDEEIEAVDIDDDDCYIFEDQYAGSVDPELTEIMFPNGGAPVIIDEDDMGTVESGLVDALIPNSGAPIEESVETMEQAETESAENDTDPSDSQLQIALDAGQTIHTGEQTVLIAQPESEITGVVTWEILDDSREEVWETIGLGKRLVLDITEEILNRQIRFVLEDGSMSEIFELTETEDQEEPEQKAEEQTAEGNDEEETAETTEESEEEAAEAAGESEEETAETTEESEEEDAEAAGESEEETAEAIEESEEETTEATTGESEEAAEATEESEEETTEATARESEEETTEASGESEEETAETTEEPEEETTEAAEESETMDSDTEEPDEGNIRAWISAEITTKTDDTEEEAKNNAVLLTAEADIELDESIIWQMKTDNDAKWTNIWYGKTCVIELTDENANSIIRFKTSEGLISEEYCLMSQKSVNKEQNTEADENNAEKASVLPGDRSVSFTITGDEDVLHLGDVAHFNAELVGYEGLDYTIQWQMSADNENWEDVLEANEMQMDLVLTEENSKLFWRVIVKIHMLQTNKGSED